MEKLQIDMRGFLQTLHEFHQRLYNRSPKYSK
jgi:hypothetical protein